MKALLFICLLVPFIQGLNLNPCDGPLPPPFNTLPLPTPADCDCLENFLALNNSCTNGTAVHCYQFLNLTFLSGHTVDDLGDYEACTNYTENNYILALLKDDKTGLAGYTGLCVPNNCTAATLTFWANYTLLNMSAINLAALPANATFQDNDAIQPTEDGIMVLAFIVIGVVIVLNVLGHCLTPSAEEKYIAAKKEINISSNDISILKDPREDNSSMEDHSKIATKKKPTGERKGFLPKFFSCFDFKENYNDLIVEKKVPGHDDNLYIFNGIRFLAFSWVVFGHTWEIAATNSKDPATIPVLMLRQPVWLNIVGAFYAVDIFFFLSGFLAAYLLIGKVKKMKFSILNYIKIMLHRFLRIWPAYVFCILFFWRIAPLIGNGPMWFEYINYSNQCDGTAWKNMLFIDNLARTNQENYCFLWGWYLACDMQIFLIVPIICWIYHRDSENGRNFIWFCFIVSVACGYGSAIGSNYYYSINNDSQNSDFLNSFYTNPFVRATPYLIGTYAGIAYKKYKSGEEKNFFNTLEKNLCTSWIVCLFGLGIILFISYFPSTLQNYGTPWSQAFGYTWNVLDRPTYVMGLFFFLAPVMAGNLKFIKNVMSCGFFNLMAKLTFCAYLIHVMVVAYIFFGATQFADLETTTMVYSTLAALLITMILATFLHLMVEKPFGNLEAKLLNPRPKPKDISQERDELMQAKISVQDTN